MKNISMLVCLFLLLFVVSTANAASVFYSNETEFLNVAGNVSLESFESGAMMESWSRKDWGDFTSGNSNAGAGHGQRVTGGYPTHGSKSLLFTAATRQYFDFRFDNPIFSLGFSTVDLADTGDAEFRLYASNGDDFTWQMKQQNDSQENFFGLVSDVGFSYIRFSVVQGGDVLNSVWLDEVYYGASPIPVPTTMLLLGFGLIGLAGVSRGKK